MGDVTRFSHMMSAPLFGKRTDAHPAFCIPYGRIDAEMTEPRR
jgi:hypothetical protein